MGTVMHGPKVKPHILFVMTDHQRYDSLFMEQCGLEVTPNLNRLAREASLFLRAYNSAPICVPARTALATGKYPTHNGVVYNDWEGRRAGDHKPLHQYLAEAGYRLGHCGVHHIQVKPGLRDRVHFDLFIDQHDHLSELERRRIRRSVPEAAKTAVSERVGDEYRQRNYSNAFVMGWEHPLESFKDVYFTDRAVSFIEQAPDSEPFALFVNLWAPHPPLLVPEPYDTMFDPAGIALPESLGMPADGEPPRRRLGAAAQLAEAVDPDGWRQAWSAHLGLTRLADDCIGRLVQALKTKGVYEQTVILFMSDHGDHMGQHRMYQKMEMYEQAIRVPMMIKAPGYPASALHDVVSHLDVVPTLLDLLGLDIPPDLDGLSLTRMMAGEARMADREVFCQYSGNSDVGDIRRAVVTNRYKYVYDPDDEEELYDLVDDPNEMHNLTQRPDMAEVKRRLFQNVKKWADTHSDWVFKPDRIGETLS